MVINSIIKSCLSLCLYTIFCQLPSKFCYLVIAFFHFFEYFYSLKVFFMFFMFAMAKAIVPRYRYDQLMRLGWKVFLPLSLAMVVIVAGVLQFGTSPGPKPT